MKAKIEGQPAEKKDSAKSRTETAHPVSEKDDVKKAEDRTREATEKAKKTKF